MVSCRMLKGFMSMITQSGILEHRPCLICFPFKRLRLPLLLATTILVGAFVQPLQAGDEAPSRPKQDQAARQYLKLLENFSGWAEEHWSEKEQCYKAKGAGVSWSRGNGDVCIVQALLLTELPEQSTISPRKIPRAVVQDHVRRTLRTLCLHNKNCIDPQAVKPPTWGGPDWQAALETEHWVVAAHLLSGQLDDATKALVRQVATAEADAAMKEIPEGKPGDTAADDCAWNAGILGVAAAVYADDPRAAKWDDWAKRWALNMEARASDRTSQRMVSGKPLSEWLVSTQVHPDFTLENHGFWDLPYQVSFAALVEPIIAYQLSGKKIPEAFYANVREEGENILKWMTLADGDLLCPQGLDWAERDVQHSWAFTELGTLLDQPWALAAEARCLRLLTDRQSAFEDGALHANDFGYETDLANCWVYSYYLHKFFGKPQTGREFDEPTGAKIFPYVNVGVYRTPKLVSSVTWFRSRQAVMIVPNQAQALGDFPSFTSYKCKVADQQVSGLGYLKLAGKAKLPAFQVEGEPQIQQDKQSLSVTFRRTLPRLATQKIGYCALPGGEVLVFSRWIAINDLEVAELADHPFYWMAIPGYLPKREATAGMEGLWSIDGKLQVQVLGGAGGKNVKNGFIGSFRGTPWTAKAGEVMQESVCIYQAQATDHQPNLANGNARRVALGEWTIEFSAGGEVSIRH